MARRKSEYSNEIETPVFTGNLRFHTGGIIKFRGAMESGKTRGMFACLFQVIKTQNFDPKNVFCNCWVDLPGAHWLRNDELRKVIRRAFNTEFGGGRWAKCIFLVMDADDLYSHITQSDKECYEDIKRASQAYKRNMYLFYEIHDGLGVPKYLRDKTEVSIAPRADEPNDRLDLYVADRHYNQRYILPIEHISRINARYRRFDDNF
jgi:hypothetical protein